MTGDRDGRSAPHPSPLFTATHAMLPTVVASHEDCCTCTLMSHDIEGDLVCYYVQVFIFLEPPFVYADAIAAFRI